MNIVLEELKNQSKQFTLINMHIPPKKSLGQNFLKSKQALRDIVNAGDIKSTDIILEIGPGKGALTDLLLPLALTVIAVEKDARLITLLQEKYAEEIKNKKLIIIEQDILELDPLSLKIFGEHYKIIANIPYYITGALIQKFLTTVFQPERMVLLLQKEVAKRIVAQDKKESILSLSVKAYGTPKYMGTVHAKYFSPEPNVNSAILLVSDISKKFFTEIHEEQFFEVVKSGFAHKRKMLSRNIKQLVETKHKNVETVFAETGIQKTVRAEDLTLEQFQTLAKNILISS